jgi:hypothetical protein
LQEILINPASLLRGQKATGIAAEKLRKIDHRTLVWLTGVGAALPCRPATPHATTATAAE